MFFSYRASGSNKSKNFLNIFNVFYNQCQPIKIQSFELRSHQHLKMTRFKPLITLQGFKYLNQNP